MFKRKQINTAIIAGALLIGTSAVVAQEDIDVTASVSVQNAFNLAQTTALNFGTLRVTQSISSDLLAGARVELPGDGSAPTATAGTVATAGPSASDTAAISIITPGTPAVFTIDSAAPNTAMTLTVDASTSLTAAGTSGTFVVNFVETDDAVVIGGINDGDAYTGFNLTTDGTGAVGFSLGGTLTTALDFQGPYIDTTYTGDYNVEVSY